MARWLVPLACRARILCDMRIDEEELAALVEEPRVGFPPAATALGARRSTSRRGRQRYGCCGSGAGRSVRSRSARRSPSML